MAKKRKSTKKSAPAKPQHSLPAGFWSQVGAVMLILLSLLLVVSWFGVGGPVLQWIDMATVKTIGYTAYALPILLIYLAVETFRAEENQLPAVVKFAAILEIVWFSGLFGLMKTSSHPNSGGFGRHIKHGNLENGRFGNCGDYLSGFGVYNSSIYYSNVTVYGFQ